MVIKKFYIAILIITCFWACKTEKEEIKADQSSVFVGKYHGILAHGDSQFPSLTQDSWEVEVSRLNENEVSLDIQTQLQQRSDVLSPFINTGSSNSQNFNLGKITPTRSFEIKEIKETTFQGEKRNTDVSITGRLRETGVLVLEVKYDYLNGEGVRFFTVLLNKK
ncbi:hypothetical protein [Dyadobacter sp. CY347]|uniref:hypothetical protein n=1 Tax=Dyadobacter sp. CY347 TaxID=2909336 RepID=UPI001F41007A|nr:hypothetical protein [Dyadobacter sp. CY347]MCF2490775.1 hypothetical protein [Dyadobacter sp. CY347]